MFGLSLSFLSGLLFFFLETVFHPSSRSRGLVGLGLCFLSVAFSAVAVLGLTACWLDSLFVCGLTMWPSAFNHHHQLLVFADGVGTVLEAIPFQAYFENIIPVY